MTQTGAARELYDDQRGAVMITGLFMSCFLIGALWFIMGVGDAIIFRDRMQEAADSGAFTSAALHAKGMNFISACNLLMLVMIAVHILLGIIHDVLLAVCIVTLGFGCGAWVKARKVYTGYEKFFKPAVRVLHALEVAAAYGYPYLGFIKGMRVGGTYGNDKKVGGVTVLAVSSSMVPGQLIVGSGNGVLTPGAERESPSSRGVTGTKKLGLPVEPKKFSDVCKKIGNTIFDAGMALAREKRSVGGRAMRIVQRIIGDVLSLRYCNDMGSGAASTIMNTFGEEFDKGNEAVDEANADIRRENQTRAENGERLEDTIERAEKKSFGGGIDPGFDKFWGEDGPLHTIAVGRNGSQWMQVWSINLSPKYTEQNERRVKIASRMGGGPDGEQGSFAYFAQAEFYFDCDDKWGEPACNGGSRDSNASYAIKWRARLRRLQAPAIGDFVAGWLFEAITGSTTYENAKKWITDNNPVFDWLSQTAGGAVGQTILKSAIESFISDFESFGQDRLGDVGGLVNPEFGGIYH
jgi:hypothetical protein